MSAHESAAAPEGTPHSDGAARMTEGNLMDTRANIEAIDDDARRAHVATILERAEADERARRARFARPLDFSRLASAGR